MSGLSIEKGNQETPDRILRVPVMPTLKEVFNHQWEIRKNAKKLIPYLFVNRTGIDGIKRFDKAWKRGCLDSGIGVRLFHDFRRTDVRNMVGYRNNSFRPRSSVDRAMDS